MSFPISSDQTIGLALERLDAGRKPEAAVIAAEQQHNTSELREKFDEFVGSVFFGQLLKSMRQTLGEPAYFHGGRAEKIFQAQLDQTIVERIATGRSGGVADAMFELFTAGLQRSE